jgi:hypothetical protein
MDGSPPPPAPLRRPVVAGVAVAVGGLAVAFVLLSLSRPTPETYIPSPVLAWTGADLHGGPHRLTVDASEPDRWVHVSLRRGTVVEHPGPTDWDLAFRRFQVIVNGGDGFAGKGGIVALEATTLDDVEGSELSHLAPERFVVTRVRSDSTLADLPRWYDYSFLSHLLTPRAGVYAVRLADGGLALLEFVGYYCPGPTPGCVTVRYHLPP